MVRDIETARKASFGTDSVGERLNENSGGNLEIYTVKSTPDLTLGAKVQSADGHIYHVNPMIPVGLPAYGLNSTTGKARMSQDIGQVSCDKCGCKHVITVTEANKVEILTDLDADSCKIGWSQPTMLTFTAVRGLAFPDLSIVYDAGPISMVLATQTFFGWKAKPDEIKQLVLTMQPDYARGLSIDSVGDQTPIDGLCRFAMCDECENMYARKALEYTLGTTYEYALAPEAMGFVEILATVIAANNGLTDADLGGDSNILIVDKDDPVRAMLGLYANPELHAVQTYLEDKVWNSRKDPLVSEMFSNVAVSLGFTYKDLLKESLKSTGLLLNLNDCVNHYHEQRDTSQADTWHMANVLDRFFPEWQTSKTLFRLIPVENGHYGMTPEAIKFKHMVDEEMAREREVLDDEDYDDLYSNPNLMNMCEICGDTLSPADCDDCGAVLNCSHEETEHPCVADPDQSDKIGSRSDFDNDDSGESDE